MKTTLKGYWQHVKSYFTYIEVDAYHSSHLPTLKVHYRNGRTILNGKRVNYAYGVLNDFFVYAFQKTNLPRPWMQKVLILGFGVGNVARLLHAAKPDLHITGIEISPEMKAIAERYFQMPDSSNLEVYWEQDAVEWIFRDSATYDLIIQDVFIEDEVPGALYQSNVLQKLDQLLAPGGVFLFNHLAGNKELQQKGLLLRQRMQSLFGEANVYHFSFGVNQPCIYEKPLEGQIQ